MRPRRPAGGRPLFVRSRLFVSVRCPGQPHHSGALDQPQSRTTCWTVSKVGMMRVSPSDEDTIGRSSTCLKVDQGLMRVGVGRPGCAGPQRPCEGEQHQAVGSLGVSLALSLLDGGVDDVPSGNGGGQAQTPRPVHRHCEHTVGDGHFSQASEERDAVCGRDVCREQGQPSWRRVVA